MVLGPALLLTHGCAMDKPDRETGGPRISHLQFAPLRALAACPPNVHADLRLRKPAPYELVYVGETEHWGEAVAPLTETFHLPAWYFQLAFEQFGEHSEAKQGDGPYVVAMAHGERTGRMDSSDRSLMLEKMIRFWTRLAPA